MSAKGLTMTVVAVAVAAATYFGLEFAFPPVKEEHPGLARLASVDEVFAGSLQEPAAPAADATTAAPQPEAPADVLTMNETAAPEPTMDEGTATEAPAPQPQSEPAAIAPTEPPPQAEPEPEPESAPAAAPAPKPQAAPAPPAKPETKPAPAKKAEPLTQWWGPESPTQLSLVYAGSAAYTRAIVLMFNGAFDDTASAAKNLRVTDASGKAVGGSWQVGANNKRMLLLPVSKAGVYTVSVGAGLSDRSGRKTGKAIKGPVRVQ